MWRGIPEADWKIFRQLHEVWLDRYCTSVNEQMRRLLSDGDLSSHERYLKIYKFIREKDKELGFAFNDFRRSTATLQLRIIWNLGLVTEEELAGFSDSGKMESHSVGPRVNRRRKIRS